MVSGYHGDGPGLAGDKLTTASLVEAQNIPIVRERPHQVEVASEWMKSLSLDTFRSGHHQKINSLGWNMTGNRLATGSADMGIKIWDLDNAQLKLRCSINQAHSQAVQQICWSKTQPDMLISTSWDKNVILWDTRTDLKRKSAKKVATVVTKGENINLCWSPDGNTIAVGSKVILLLIGNVLICFSKEG